MRRAFIALAVVTWLACAVGCKGDKGSAGPPGPAGPPAGDPVTAVEACLGCHGENGSTPVYDITDPSDAHYIDLANGFGPPSASGYRKLFPMLTRVDVTGSSVVIDFDVEDELGQPVDNLEAGDGRFTIARLAADTGGDPPSAWRSLIEVTRSPAAGSPMEGVGPDQPQGTAESFSASGFTNFNDGSYRYVSNFDPSNPDPGFDPIGDPILPVADGETLRVAIQLSRSDLPDGFNGWCDFDADLSFANDCVSGTTLSREIVETDTCNVCHGATDDTQLGIHGGGRTDVEYCVTCHNPYSADPDTGNTVDMTVMIHKIHRGADLNVLPYQIWGFRNSVHDYSEVHFTKDIDDCTNCHAGGGNEVDNWFDVPTAEACGACHDDVDFESGANHAGGSSDNSRCFGCHRPGTPRGADVAHRGVQRATLADRYAFVIDDVRPNGDLLEVDYMVELDGLPMSLDAPEWTAGSASRLHISVGWETSDYTNVDSGATPALPIDIDALPSGGVATDLGGGLYQVVADLDGTGAGGTVTVLMDGHPAADLNGDTNYDDRIAVRNDYWSIDIDGGRAVTVDRRDVVDVDKCNACHDAAGQGISLHGNNRTGEIQVCVVCHNPNATDINRRPAPPAVGSDGKAEESIDMKRMIHQIHSGSELANGVVIYGFGNTEHDYGSVNFIGNRMNCETCHDPGTYAAAQAALTLPSTIDTGADAADPDDDLNISSIAAVCSSCHDDSVATDHMKLHGASFQALDADIR